MQRIMGLIKPEEQQGATVPRRYETPYFQTTRTHLDMDCNHVSIIQLYISQQLSSMLYSYKGHSRIGELHRRR